MLNTLRGDGFDCLLTLLSIKMEHPRPLQVCTNACIIFAHKGARVIRLKTNQAENSLIYCNFILHLLIKNYTIFRKMNIIEC